MNKVAVVTDSTACIPNELLKGYPIYCIPLQVIWGEDTYRDGIDITPEEFYSRLKTTDILPSTSQPSPAIFERTYRRLLEEGYDIISIHISSKLSGTYDSAIQAKENIKSNQIVIIDSFTSGMALGFEALEIARAAHNGSNLKDSIQLANKTVKNTGVLFAVKTLEFLHRGGRIGGASAFVGTALGLKPILEVQDGKVEAVGKIRTMAKAIDRVIDIMVERVGNRRPIRISTMHANAPQEAELMLQKTCERFNSRDIAEAFSSGLSPVVGTHTGPGTVGLTYMAGI